jgi:hypothetical protein
MTLYEDTKKSYYTILKRKLNEGNGNFQAILKNGGCYSGNPSKGHQRTHENFKKFVTSQNKILSVSGNIIPIDKSVFNNFPQGRPPTCVKQGTTGTWDRGSNPNEWTRNWYWSEKQGDYNRIKTEIDLKLSLLKLQETEEKILADQQKVINQIPVTPISDIPVITSSPINNDEVPEGYHKMPDGTIMKGSEHKTEREKLVEKTGISILVIGAIGLYLALRFKS